MEIKNLTACKNALGANGEKTVGSKWFSAKSDSENYFGSFAGKSLNVVSVYPDTYEAKDGTKSAFVAVEFGNGMCMSFRNFATMAGLAWGDARTLNARLDALNDADDVTIVPITASESPIQRKSDNKYYHGKDKNGRDVWKAQREGCVMSSHYVCESNVIGE